jgi:predicted transcriptional regulator
MKRKSKPSLPKGRVYVEWDIEAKLVKQIDKLAPREGRTREALIEGALADYLARRRHKVAEKQRTD